MTTKPWLRLVFVCSLCKIGFFLVFIASIFFLWFPTPLWFIFKILHSCRYFCVWHSSLRFHLITLISSVLHLIISAPWRNKQSWKIPRGNQNRQSEEGTTQHNIQQKKAKGQTTIYETLHRKKKNRSSNMNTNTTINRVWTQVLRNCVNSSVSEGLAVVRHCQLLFFYLYQYRIRRSMFMSMYVCIHYFHFSTKSK